MGVAGAAVAAPVPAPELAAAQLRAINHRFVEASIHPDNAFMAALAADEFLALTTSGDWHERTEFLAGMREPARYEGASYSDVGVRLYGEVAVVQGVFEGQRAGSVPGRVRYTDVYVWSGSSWRLVGGANSRLKEGTPIGLQSGVVPAFAAWQGKDPQGDNEAVLRALNANYVKAFRESDVAWYDAHLAPDYNVVYGDGSFHDRAGALADFAKPTFAEQLALFPVGNVRIRRFGDIALISAENAYERKDGRKGENRYTDIWLKQDGRWRCIQAHITVHKAPVA
jgi:ketosteroid isomerase-like protein